MARPTFEATDFLERPPLGNITSPKIMCPGWLSRQQSMVDFDDDLDSVRWYVDDMLMAPAIEQIWLTGSARAEDRRHR